MKTYESNGSDEIRFHIGETIAKLLENQSFEDIKVTSVYQSANVGKTTYYRYFGTKSGIKDALYFYVRTLYQSYCEKHPDQSRDQNMIRFLYSEKNLIQRLYAQNLADIMDRLLLSVFGPDESQDYAFYYTYIGAGMWMGLLRAMVESDFSLSPTQIEQQIQTMLTNTISGK